MPSHPSVWVAQGVHCPICRGKHDLCFGHEPEAKGVYRLNCPTTGKSHDITLDAEAAPQPACPAGGVPVDKPIG